MTTIAEKHQIKHAVAEIIYQYRGKLISGYDAEAETGAAPDTKETPMSVKKDYGDREDEYTVGRNILIGCAVAIVLGLVIFCAVSGYAIWTAGG